MQSRMRICACLLLGLAVLGAPFIAVATEAETLPPLSDGQTLDSFEEMWSGFDPSAEPLEVEVLKEWEEESVVFRIVRFRIGVFKGHKAVLAAIYGYPKSLADGEKIPGLLQIHGGGQYADHKACLMNAKRGYATLSIAWAGRISAPGYRVGPNEVQLYWDEKTENPAYRLTTDWGAVDGYHAPGRNAGNQFPSAKPAAWTLDQVESPRNSGWFLCALAARRALTFLEQQPQVDPNRLGVYGHSMGGKLTVMTAVDSRVKAAAPSCGGISDRYNDSPLFRATLGDDVSLKEISCPIAFLSPSNDFHGRIGNLPDAIDEIQSKQWRVTCSPHHNHQDTSEYEVATLLWFDQFLQSDFEFPATPEVVLNLETADGVPTLNVLPDTSAAIRAINVFYTQHGKEQETPRDIEHVKHRFWRYAPATKVDDSWAASLPLASTDKPLWAYANVVYQLENPVSGAGYYYGLYTAESFNVSSLLTRVTPDELSSAGVRATVGSLLTIESFADGWQHEWFSYKPEQWARSTNKLSDETWKAPADATLTLDVLAEEPNQLVVRIDDYAAVIELEGGQRWQEVKLASSDFCNLAGEALANWQGIRQLTLSPSETLRSGRGENRQSRVFGQQWRGPDPTFRDLRWNAADLSNAEPASNDDGAAESLR